MASKLIKSYYHAPNDNPVVHTIPELLDIRGTKHPEKEAFVIRVVGQPRQVITFGELKSKTEQLAAGLIKRGLKKGDCVGLLCPSSIEYAICEYALARTGAILMRFHVSVKTGEDIKYMLKKSNCRWLIAHPGNEDGNYRLFQGLIPDLQLHGPTQKLFADDLPDLETIFMISSASYPGTTSWTALFEGFQDGDLDIVRIRQDTIEMDDIQGCYATSGSTGNPKLVAARHSYSLNFARSLYLKGGVDETDRLAVDRPMPYAGGSTGVVLSIGLTMVCVISDTKQKRGKDFYFTVIEEEACTVVYNFPYLLHALIQKIDNKELDVSRVKLGLTGGETVQKPMLERCMTYLPGLMLGYGSTEAGVPLGGWKNDSVEHRINNTGLGYEGEFKVIDNEGAIVPVNTPGELCLRNHYLFVKYWGDEEKTKLVKDHLGWYKTDDMAVMNEDGYVTILGRKQEVISKATIKIYPRSIERELLQHPLVENAVAVGIPHEILYEEICLCVVPKQNEILTVEDVRQYCKDRFFVGEIGQGLMPDHILMFEKFPAGSTDKTDRKKTREQAVARLTK